jgi:hypothetical protein
MKDDNRRALWVMTRVIVRAAVNKGYHRDPSFSSISNSEAEYRSRVLLSDVSLDNLASFQLDFPRIIPKIYSNTKEPFIVHDRELSEYATTVTPARPLSEITPVTYLIAKGTLYDTSGRVTGLNSSPRLGSYETGLDIDRALVQGLENSPSYVKAVISSDNTTTSVTANLSAYSILHAYHLGMCNLHRRFMARAREDARFSLSRERCVSCATALLGFQRNLNPKFYEMSRTRQTFAPATMLLFMELELRKDDTKREASPDSHSLLNTLETSASSWAEAAHIFQKPGASTSYS